MQFEKVNDFVKRIKKSRSTVFRFYAKNEELKEETKIKKKKRMIPIEHSKYFDSEIMFEENKELRSKNKAMRNLIDGLSNKNSLQTRLWYMDWSFFITVAYKTDRNKKSCYKQISSMYEMLIKKYGDKTTIRVFFNTEPFTNKEGHHNHLMLHIQDKRLHEQAMKDIQSFFKYDRVDFSPYNKYEAGIYYMSKEGMTDEDWDILGNNLSNEN